MARVRKICYVTGTRAEFGLMRSTLQAIRAHPQLKLQLVVTGMHLDRALGRSVEAIRRDQWKIDATVPWPAARGPAENAACTGTAVAGLARVFEKLKPDVVLVTGDRVEAFAAATAAHLSHRAIAHVHGGDRALGQVDDSLRHAITKLAHLHFPATAASAKRIARLGEDEWRIHQTGSPGLDGITTAASDWAAVASAFPALPRRRYALLVLHPTCADERLEEQRARMVFSAVRSAGFEAVVTVYPNNDPGSGGIVRCWNNLAARPNLHLRTDIPRALFLGLMRDAAAMVGNSSSGIIEAASFGTPVLNIGPRQAGRERSANTQQVDFEPSPLKGALARIWNNGRPRRSQARNVYGGDGAGQRIAAVLARSKIDHRLLRKLIAY